MSDATDCKIRTLAHEFGLQTLAKARAAFPLTNGNAFVDNTSATLADALELAARCNATPPPRDPATTDPMEGTRALGAVGLASRFYVDFARGSDAGTGALASPLKTVAAGVARARRATKPAAVVLRGGTHVLTQSIVLGPADEGLLLMNYPAEEPWITGAVPLRTSWQKDEARQARGINSWVTAVSIDPQVSSSLDGEGGAALAQALAPGGLTHGLRVGTERGIPARFPNANPELDRTPVGWLPADAAASWLPRAPIKSNTTFAQVLSPNRGNITVKW